MENRAEHPILPHSVPFIVREVGAVKIHAARLMLKITPTFLSCDPMEADGGAIVVHVYHWDRREDETGKWIG